MANKEISSGNVHNFWCKIASLFFIVIHDLRLNCQLYAVLWTNLLYIILNPWKLHTDKVTAENMVRLQMKNLPTLHNDSSFVVQVNNILFIVSKTRGI